MRCSKCGHDNSTNTRNNEICRMWEEGRKHKPRISQIEIARKFGLSNTTVRNILIKNFETRGNYGTGQSITSTRRKGLDNANNA